MSTLYLSEFRLFDHVFLPHTLTVGKVDWDVYFLNYRCEWHFQLLLGTYAFIFTPCLTVYLCRPATQHNINNDDGKILHAAELYQSFTYFLSQI